MKANFQKGCWRIGCVSTQAGLACLRRKSDGDGVEVRLDALLKSGAKLPRIFSALEKRRKPVLLTLRAEKEGGCHRWKRGERQELFLQLLPCVDAVDVELASVVELQSVLKEARRLKREVVLSAHALKKSLNLRQLKELLRKFQQQKADVYKVAAFCRSHRDLAVLSQTLVENSNLPLAVMAVGPMAGLSRVVLPALGSRLVYGYLDKPAAPGQPSIGEVAKQLDGLGLK